MGKLMSMSSAQQAVNVNKRYCPMAHCCQFQRYMSIDGRKLLPMLETVGQTTPTTSELRHSLQNNPDCTNYM